MSKFELIEAMKEKGFSENELLDMFIYWLDIGEVEKCVDDFLSDRGSSITIIRENKYEDEIESFDDIESDLKAFM